jgi:hypothetical protein
MAFCNSCGANLVPGTRFCNTCGAAILASTLPSASATPPVQAPVPAATPAAAPSGGGALKAVLIVVGVIVVVGILAVAAGGVFAWRIAHRTHVRQDGDNVKVETPFGTVETTKDPDAAARNIGIDLYPGAEVLKNGSTSASFGPVHTATLNSETSDSVDQVCAFYKPKYPNAMVMTSDENQCTIVSNDPKNTVTITVKPEGGKTRIVITHVTHASNESN